MAPALVVLEATGEFEVPAAAAGLAVVIANPRQVRDFAKATGQVGEDRRGRQPAGFSVGRSL